MDWVNQRSIPPSLVKACHGGMESCPTTGREHFQGALNTAQCRFSQVKSILPNSHIEACISTAKCLTDYALKVETAIGEKRSVINNRYMRLEDLMIAFGMEFLKDHDVKRNSELFDIYGTDGGYWEFARRIYDERPYLTNLLTQPQSHRAWVNLGPSIIHMAYITEGHNDDSISIVLPDDE